MKGTWQTTSGGGSSNGVSFILILALAIVVVVAASAAALTAILNALVTLLLTLVITVVAFTAIGALGALYFHRVIEPRRMARIPPWQKGIPDRRMVYEMDARSPYPKELMQGCTINYAHDMRECNGIHISLEDK